MGKEITPYYFRHRLCTIATDRGMPINAVRAVTGIKDINVLLQYYEHSTSEGKAKVVGVSRLK